MPEPGTTAEKAAAPEAATGLKGRLYGVPVIGTALRMQDRYVDDDADQLAAAIGFFGFLSLFPLILLALAVAGLLLKDDPAAQARFADAVVDAIPGFAGSFSGEGSSVGEAIAGLTRNAGSVGLVGLVSLLLTGLKVINSAHVATMAVFHVDVRVSGLLLKLRQVAVLAVLGLFAVLGVAATALVAAAATLATDGVASAAGGSSQVNGALQFVATIAGLAGSVAADFLLFVASYKLLSFGRGPRFAQVWPGALLAALGWTALKAFGATYVSNQIAKTNELVGTFGGVVGLLLLLYLAGRVYLYGAELSALLRRPGPELAERHEQVRYEGEDPHVIGPRFLARKEAHDRAVLAAAQQAHGRVALGPARAPETPVRARATAPAPGQPSPTVSVGTQTRLQELDAERRVRRDVGLGGPTGLGGTPGEREGRVAAGRTADGSPDVRGAAAVAFGVGAVGALVAAAKPWKRG